MACKDKKKKRVFGKFTINRLAGVVEPMQGDALQVIMKRRGPDDSDEEVDIYKGYRLLSTIDGHTHMINDSDANGYTSYTSVEGDEYSHDHPWVKNDDGSLSIGVVNNHTHEVIIKSDNKEVTKMTEKVKTDPGDLQVVNKKLEDTQTKLDKALALADMNDETKAFYKNLSDSEKVEFIAKSAEEKAEMIDKAKEADPVVYKAHDGTQYRKSDGERMVKLAKQADKALTIAKAATDQAETETFTKAADKLGCLPGTQEAKIVLLKAIDGIEDEAIRKAANEILTAGNANLKDAFARAGVEGNGPHEESGPVNKLDALAKAHANAKSIGYEKAYTEVLETPEGQELYAQIEVKPVA
jgi:hypothetical protein